MAAEESTALVRRLLDAVRDSWSPAVIDEFFAADYRRHLTATTPPITADQQADLFRQLGVSAIRDS